ncbi:bacteriocin immunity protein [Companilactobacillus mindensis]|jgi:Enterocin A Immunity.|nr:bacteriocin immunity protein [Companilactobacillus mindensis]GEO78628.1 hypothetical protein LMI01_09590 [Companilactobacillus mindensis]
MNKTAEKRTVEKIDREMLQKLEDTYNNPDMEKRPDLKKIIQTALKEFQQTENVDQVVPKLFRQIANNYIEDPKNFPESLIELYYQCRMLVVKYDGVEWSDVQAGLTWFE